MKIDFDEPLTDLSGEVLTQVKIGWMQAATFTFGKARSGVDVQSILQELEKAEGEPITLGAACVDALLSSPSADKAAGKEKLRRYKLAKRIDRGGIVSIAAKDDVSFLDDCLAEWLKPVGYGAANALLYPDEDVDTPSDAGD